MNDEIKIAVAEAIAPLKQDIEALKKQLAPLVGMIPKPQELPAPVKEAKAVFDGIPKDVLASLKVVGCTFDPKSPWFQLVCADRLISVKRTEVAVRVRVREKSGQLLAELTPPLNGLTHALKSLA